MHVVQPDVTWTTTRGLLNRAEAPCGHRYGENQPSHHHTMNDIDIAGYQPEWARCIKLNCSMTAEPLFRSVIPKKTELPFENFYFGL